jgi:hypothetical protein
VLGFEKACYVKAVRKHELLPFSQVARLFQCSVRVSSSANGRKPEDGSPLTFTVPHRSFRHQSSLLCIGMPPTFEIHIANRNNDSVLVFKEDVVSGNLYRSARYVCRRMVNRYVCRLFRFNAELPKRDLRTVGTTPRIFAMKALRTDYFCSCSRTTNDYIFPAEQCRGVFNLSAKKGFRLSIAPARYRRCRDDARYYPCSPQLHGYRLCLQE